MHHPLICVGLKEASSVSMITVIGTNSNEAPVLSGRREWWQTVGNPAQDATGQIASAVGVVTTVTP